MAKILEKRLIRKPDVYYYKIAAPLISRKAQPGQFVIIRLHEQRRAHSPVPCGHQSC